LFFVCGVLDSGTSPLTHRAYLRIPVPEQASVSFEGPQNITKSSQKDIGVKSGVF
jgi:hypothetical protein